MTNIDNVIKFFLSKEAMSPKKLQKLLYYAYSWTLALLNDSKDDLRTKLFDERIEAWVHGPVIPSVYVKYKDYGWDEIPQENSFDSNVFAADVLDVLEQVWTVYGNMNGNKLEAICHRETPWINARAGIPPFEASHAIIKDSDIFEYYNEQASK